MTSDDLGVLGNLGVALGLFESNGSPNTEWFEQPEVYLGSMIAKDSQRDALIAFVDEALGGDERETDATGTIWLPVVSLDDLGGAGVDVEVSVTVTPGAGSVDIGVGVTVETTDPGSSTSLSIPLFRTVRGNATSVDFPLLLGSPAGRIRLATSITTDAAAPVPGEPRLGAIGLDLDIPTSPVDPSDPVFGLSLTGFQMPGAAEPRDVRISADGVDELDDAVLDLVLSLLRSTAESAPAGSVVRSVGGLLGLLPGDAVPDFPIGQIPTRGPAALAAWVHGIVTTPAARAGWIGYLAGLVGGTAAGDTVGFDLGGDAALTLGLRVDTGPSGNARLTPTLAIELGGDDARVEARADLFRVDLVTGSAIALPQLGIWAAFGTPGDPVLSVAGPPAVSADTLRVGFGLDAQRRLNFVLAADGVDIGGRPYATLDLTSPDAVMDAVGNTIEQVAEQLLGELGDALDVARLLLGLEAPAGVSPITLGELMADPLAAIAAYWNELVLGPVRSTAVPAVLEALRDAVADAASAVATVRGSGTLADPWHVELIGPLRLEAWTIDDVLSIGFTVATSVDDLGGGCAVIEARLSATIAEIDLGAPSASLLPGVHTSLTARERGADPHRITLELPGGLDGVSVTASRVGLRIGWSPVSGLVAAIDAPGLTLVTPSATLPVTLPTVGTDGVVDLPDDGWDALEALVGYLGDLVGGVLGDVVVQLGWSAQAVGDAVAGIGGPRLRLADIVDDAEPALRGWLAELPYTDMARPAIASIASLFADAIEVDSGATGAAGLLARVDDLIDGTGRPDDPYRFAIDPGVPNVAVWFPPDGPPDIGGAIATALDGWSPGDDGLDPADLVESLAAHAVVDEALRDLITGRSGAVGLTALIERWSGGDGRISPPATAPPGVTVTRRPLAAGQLFDDLDLPALIGRSPSVVVHVAVGTTADIWPTAPAARRIDLTAPGLTADMFSIPAMSAGEWFVALGTRAACKLPTSTTDGTPEQAARLGRVLDALATVSNDVALVGLGGGGHAARLAAEAHATVADVVTVGTPLTPIALTALTTQPTADALRLLHRLLPAATGTHPDVLLGRGLVEAMIELTTLADPTADLRLPAVAPTVPRAGLSVNAVFGEVAADTVGRAVTAIVAGGLGERIAERTPPVVPTTSCAGLRLVVAPTSTGTLAISGDALLTLVEYDRNDGFDVTPELRVNLAIADRTGWLVATHDVELRRVTAEVVVRLDGEATGTAVVRLHDARVFGQSWERLVLGVGPGPGAVPVLPEARALLAAAVQRLTADAGASASAALLQLLAALGITADIPPVGDAQVLAGGVVGDAVDQLIHDPGGLIRGRLAAHRDELASAVTGLLGPVAGSVDLATGSVTASGSGTGARGVAWDVDLTLSPAGLAGTVTVGAPSVVAAASAGALGGLAVTLGVDTTATAPVRVDVRRHGPAGSIDTLALWPAPDPAAIARAVADSCAGLAGQVAIEVLRRADAEARAIVDRLLAALGLLDGTVGDAAARVRPVVGLLADPAGWLRSELSLAAEPARIQHLLDALRPILGLTGAPGSPLALGTGVVLGLQPMGGGTRVGLTVAPGMWVTPTGATGRLAVGATITIDVGPTGPPAVGLAAHVGLAGAPTGRQAVHVALGTSGACGVFLRPTSGPDVSLLPFAGLGAVAAAAEAALPYLLDRLAEIPGDIGEIVGEVGDALGLRSGTPAAFDGGALHDWAIDPVASLTDAIPTLVATGLAAVAPLLDGVLATGVSAAAGAGTLTVGIGDDVTLVWNPGAGTVRLVGDEIAVPGIDRVSFAVQLGTGGLDELAVTVGPAEIDAEGVVLRPFVSVAVGADPPDGRKVAVGLSAGGDSRFAARWLIDAGTFALVAGPLEATDPGEIALALIDVIADLVASVALAQQAVQDLLDTSVCGGDVRELLVGVVLDEDDPDSLIPGMFDLDTLLDRTARLFQNLAGLPVEISVDEFTFSFTSIDDVIGVQVGLTDRFALIEGSDVSLWLEDDASWITGSPSDEGGLFVGLVTADLDFAPTLVVNGLGLRVGGGSGPLLDAGVVIDSIALHVYAAIDGAGPKSGGVQIQVAGLAVSAGGAQGDNGIAQGIMNDTGPKPPQPKFSPALAVQKHDDDPVSFTLRAGDGDGPWWIAIQQGFGPLYLEQIGFGAEMPGGRLTSVSLLMDGSVSMFGLTCAVDDLTITYFVENGDFFNPANWAIDLAGLAVSANMAGLSIAGGLLKQTTPQGIEYLGMLLARFGVYGITIFGGYGEGVDAASNEKFTAFFAVGAINGPIGGPPAFFLTGIGGGFGINRALVVPTDLSNFGTYPLIQALDIAARPQDPMDQLRALGAYFPMERGTFWFAAGISFNSFALVDGIAVLAVEIGDGLDINLLGLARMALPRPQAAIVSIEIALLVRFSSEEGVLWVQGQLTDNSWLLYPDIKLTGGFAFVVWFKGEHRGEFVLTLGGFHPDFKRDGYPVVPRLGLRWSIGSAIVIEAGSYFALTSEAVMAGGDFHASAEFGPAWADVRFGAHGIVYFDPFRYAVNVYARIAAGITIDTWIFGEITISISIGARIDVTGPEFHGKATFEVGPVELSVEFGGSDQSSVNYMAGPAFVDKYLEAAEDGTGAVAHTAMVAFGSLPAKGEDSTPDGSAARPFVVVAEFGLTFTSTVPITRIRLTSAPAPISNVPYPPSKVLGVAPMGTSSFSPELRLTWVRTGTTESFPFVPSPRAFGAFPSGVWGPPQDMNNRKVPKAVMIEALNEIDLVAVADPSAGGPEIPYFQVEIGKRKPLPFSRRQADVDLLRAGSASLAGLVATPTTVAAAFQNALTFLSQPGSDLSATSLASLRGERQAPPRLGTLGEGLDIDAITVVPDIGARPPGRVYDHFVDAPIAIGLMSGASVDLRTTSPARTTVKGSARAWRTAPPTMASVEAERSKSIAARLVIRDAAAVKALDGAASRTVVAATKVPVTASAHAPVAVVARRGAPGETQLAAFTDALARPATSRRARRAGGSAAFDSRIPGTTGASLLPGQTVVLKLPNAAADVAEGERPWIGVERAPARVVLIGAGGEVLDDAVVVAGPDGGDQIAVLQGTERIVAIGQGATSGEHLDAGLAGWYAGMQLPYAGWGVAIGPACVVRSFGDTIAGHRERHDAGWVDGAELTRGVCTVTTRFAEPVTTVVIAIDDPASFGDPVGGRQLLLGLDGAARVTDAAGNERPPVVLTMENRTVLAYDVVPAPPSRRRTAVSVTIATEQGWSLVGVLGARLASEAAIAMISTRGFDAALRTFASGATGVSTLSWIGPTRDERDRRLAKALASGTASQRLAAAGIAPRRSAQPGRPAAAKPSRRTRRND